MSGSNEENRNQAVERALHNIGRHYALVGKSHIRSWYGWAVFGIVVGIVVAILLIANRSGEINSPWAAETPALDILDTQAPTVPTGFSAMAVSSSQINLSWNASTDSVGVTKYVIRRNSVKISADTTATSYQDIGLAPSTTYSYTIAAKDAAGNASGQSAAVLATTLPYTPTGAIKIKRVDKNLDPISGTVAEVIGLGTETANEVDDSKTKFVNVPTGSYTVRVTDLPGQTERYGTCTVALAATGCIVSDYFSVPVCDGTWCTASPLSVSANMITKVVFKYEPAPPTAVGTVKIKRVGLDLTVNTAPATTAWIDSGTPSTANVLNLPNTSVGAYTAYASAVSGYTVTAGICNRALANPGGCSLTSFPLTPTCDSARCSIPVTVSKDQLTKVVFLYTPAAGTIPADKFMWGFNFIIGTANVSRPGADWNITDADLISLRDDMGINAIRFFVHPAFVGLPQKTWGGPESIDYTKFGASSYNWQKFDTALEQVSKLGITPVLLPFVIDSYMSWIYKDDITFLNNLPKVDYSGIVPVEQVRAYSSALSAHVASKFPALKFGVVFTEVCGQNTEGAPLRSGEKQAWQSVTDAVHKAAPNATVFSPEACVSMWWGPTTRANNCSTFDPVYYDNNWPRGDYLENYAASSDFPAISFYGMPQSEVNVFCPALPRLKSTLDTVNSIVREHIGSKPFLWSEIGRGNDNHEVQCTTDDMNLNWASLLFADHMRGALMWHGKENTYGGKGAVKGTYQCAPIALDGTHFASYDYLKKIGDVLKTEYPFLSAYHTQKNADGIPVSSSLFQENDTKVFTRFLTKYVVVYNTDASAKTITFTNIGGNTLAEHLNTALSPLTISAGSGTVTIANIQPNKVYVLRVLPKITSSEQGMLFTNGSTDKLSSIISAFSGAFGEVFDYAAG